MLGATADDSIMVNGSAQNEARVVHWGVLAHV
jgi:hypothetical protein